MGSLLRFPVAVSLLATLACAHVLGNQFPDVVAREAGGRLLAVAHPKAELVRSEVSGHGTLDNGSTWVDVDTSYTRKGGGQDHAMRVRFTVKDTDKCRIKVDVREDTGPDPVMLDNGLVRKIAGNKLCKALAGWGLARR